MAVQPQYLAYVLEQLAVMPALRHNRMFSGVGFYSDDVFFGLIYHDTLYFKTGESNIADYLARNMPRFLPFPDRTKQVLGYHQVPADVIEDADELIVWARKAKEAALAKRAAKARRVRKTASKKVSKVASKNAWKKASKKASRKSPKKARSTAATRARRPRRSARKK